MRSMCLLRGNIHSRYFKVAKKIRSKRSCVAVWESLDPCGVRTPSLTDLPDQRSAVQILNRFSSRFLVYLNYSKNYNEF